MDKKKIIIISLAVILFILILLVIWFNFKPTPKEIVNNPDGTIIDQVIVNQIRQLPPVSNEKISEEQSYTFGLKQLAISFAEKYGSYSNHGNFAGLEDLKSMSTKRVQNYLDSLVLVGSGDINIYRGFDTRALSILSSEVDQAGGKATIIVQTQRTKITGEKQETFYQNLLLRFLLVNNEWKVDETRWQ